MGAALSTPTATISSGTALSNAIYIGHGRLDTIQIPASWTTAGITFQGSLDGVTYENLFDNTGTEMTISSPASSESMSIGTIGSTAGLAGWAWIKIRSGTSASPVNQSSTMALLCMVRKLPFPRM